VVYTVPDDPPSIAVPCHSQADWASAQSMAMALYRVEYAPAGGAEGKSLPRSCLPQTKFEAPTQVRAQTAPSCCRSLGILALPGANIV